ncbi:hypothetical protein BH11VER1_BH11VER1_03540 [soil metagenome]
MKCRPLFAIALLIPFAVAQAEEKKTAKKAPAPPTKAATQNLNTPDVADQKKMGQLPAHTAGLADEAANAFAKKDWKTARKCYQEMIAADPLNALTYANLGAVEQQSGRLKESQALFERAVTINPELQQTWTALGLVSYEKGDLYYALHALSRAVHEDPTDAKAHNYLAVVTKKLGWREAAESELQRAIELNPEYANAHFNLALMYLERTPPAIELAKRHYDKAVALGAPKDELVEEKLKAE